MTWLVVLRAAVVDVILGAVFRLFRFALAGDTAVFLGRGHLGIERLNVSRASRKPNPDDRFILDLDRLL